MENNRSNNSKIAIEEDEIDLRELFATIGRYKWSIVFITLITTAIVAVVAYKMPKYYKTTTVIEVKPKSGDKAGFSLGEAGALLGISRGEGSSSIEKDAAILKMFRANDKVLDQVRYTAQFYTYDNFRYTEIADNNSSISIDNLKIFDYKKYGMEIKLKPLSSNRFKLYISGKIIDELLGEFSYGAPIKTEYFSMTVDKKSTGIIPDKISLNSDKHYIYKKIVSDNLSAQVDKSNPFITISYMDTIPQRGEQYLKTLIDKYIMLSIGFDISDADITLNSLKKQIKEIETKVQKSAKELETYKSKQKLIAPQVQTEMVIKGNVDITEKLIKTRYQKSLLEQLIANTKNRKSIGAIGPSLVELQDQSTILLVQKLQALELEYKNLSLEFKPAHPKLKNINEQVQTIRIKIRENLKNMLKIIKKREKSLQDLLGEYKKKLSAAPTAEREISEILREFKLNEKYYGYLLQKRASAELKKAEAISRFRTIEPIYTDPAPAKPKKALIVLVGFITALILSIFLAFFREFMRGSREK